MREVRCTALRRNSRFQPFRLKAVQHASRALQTALLLAFIVPSVYARLEVFASFENQAEIAAIKGSPGVEITSSTRFAAWAANSLEVTFPASGGNLEFSKVPNDWRRQESLLLFVWSNQPAELKLTLRDSLRSRFVHAFALRTGVNHLQLRLDRVRGMDLGNMRSLVLESSRGGRFYFDYFALDRFHPRLEERGRWDIDYSMAVETPHIPWARPFTGPPIRAYAIADVAHGRGIVELAQRLELDFKATTIGRSPGTNKWGFGDFYEQRSYGGENWSAPYSLAHTYIADDLMNGPGYDVILWPGLHPWESYPAEIRDAIIKRVEAGAGLVLFAQSGNQFSPLQLSAEVKTDDSKWRARSGHYITDGLPLDAFPWGQISVLAAKADGEVLLETSQGAPVMAVRTLGKGRIVAFSYRDRGMIPEIGKVFETGLFYPYQDYLWSLVARAVVWAAKREPSSLIQKLEWSSNRVVATIKDAPQGSTLTAAIRNSFGETEAEVAAPATSADTVTLTINKPLSGGRHFADVRLMAGGKALDWGTIAFEREPTASIVSLKLNAEQVKLGENVSAAVRVRNAQPNGCIIIARLYDNYDRLIDERRMPVTGQGESDHSINLNTRGVLTHLARVDCEVIGGNVREDRRIAEVFILQPRSWDDYDVVMYRFDSDPMPGIWPAIDQHLRRMNVTTLSSYSLSHSIHANYNVQAQTRISGQESPDGPKRNYYNRMKKQYAETHDKKTLIREYCLNDPAYRELARKELNQLARPWARLSPLSYYVFEEPSLTCYEDDLDLCFSTHCMAAMRNWLKGEYDTLAALNKQWGATFASWDDVIPDDTYEAQARGNYASWADHRTFMEKTYADTFEYVLGELHKIDSQGILLNSGTQVSGAHNGCDYSRINQFTRHLNAYDGGNQMDFHRSFNPEIKISGGAGYGVLGKDVFYNFYRDLFKGANGGAYVFWQYSTLDPDLTLSQSGKDIAEGFREMRGEGIGKLVGLASPDTSGIAIHYSYPSIHGAWIVDGKIEPEVVYDPSSATARRFNANRDGWVKALRDAGLQFDFIAYGDVEKGKLVSKGYKTLILPMSIAISDKEAEAIREFTRRGGTVIADALPGVMDEHCTFREQPALASLFGVVSKRSSRETIIAMNGEPDLKISEARRLTNEAGPPILLENRQGQGRAYLLNFFLDRYPAEKKEGRAQPLLEKIERVLKSAGIKPSLKLETLAGRSIADCETYQFNQGSTRLLGLVPDKDKSGAQKVRLVLEQQGALYDVRTKRYLGVGSSFETEIEPAVPKLFALVGSRINGLQLQAPSSAKIGEEVAISFRVTGGSDLRSVAKVIVTDAAGREVSVYGGNRDIVGGAGDIRFRTALNDPKGVWRVTVTEVISGERASAEITVQ
jgi:Beta-galactosidase/Beta-galactosidase trimerisation domain